VEMEEFLQRGLTFGCFGKLADFAVFVVLLEHLAEVLRGVVLEIGED
jgi:hypothetical protein